jgi:hypothetical protein
LPVGRNDASSGTLFNSLSVDRQSLQYHPSDFSFAATAGSPAAGILVEQLMAIATHITIDSAIAVV